MVGPAVHRHHVALNAHDTVYQSKLCAFRIQDRSLLNMRLQEAADFSVFPDCFFDPLRIHTVFLHGLIDGYTVFVTEFFHVVHIPVTKDGS